MPADPLSLGDPDGYGRYGVLEEQPGGLVCHECGRTFPSLGLHAYRGHGMTAAQYRERHGLQRTAGLITAALRTRIQDNARAQMASPAGQAFIQARDPQRAQAARLAQSLPWRTATRGTNRAARVGRGRRGTEVTCANPDCQAVFCPLMGAKRRQFCSRSCATKHARRTARSQT
jgi:hypothetical protein